MNNLKEYIDLKKENGITLIALIVTIVVLLILVRVVMNNVVDDGIIDDTTSTLNQYEEYGEGEKNKVKQLIEATQ